VTSFLDYNLFEDAGHTNEFCSIPGAEIQGSGDGSATIYGLITSGQAVTDGATYTDTVTLTLAF